MVLVTEGRHPENRPNSSQYRKLEDAMPSFKSKFNSFYKICYPSASPWFHRARFELNYLKSYWDAGTERVKEYIFIFPAVLLHRYNCID